MAENAVVSNFYGRKQKRQWSKLEAAVNAQVKKHQAEKIPTEYKQTISGPSVKWKTFFRQQDAFLYARSQASDLHVFAFEREDLGSESGQRRYLVTSYPVFWHYYRQLKRDCKHHYEVIPEGAVCKLYFDLEYLKQYNPDSDGDRMVDVFVKFVSFWLEQKFGITCDRKTVLDLDASTEAKFSRHLLYQIPGVAFKDNIHAGNFVHFVAGEIMSYRDEESVPGTSGDDLPEGLTTQDLKSLIVKNKEGEDVLFCDLGVYTKNRNFRVYQSCKLGKDNPLMLSVHNLYSPATAGQSERRPDIHRQIFMDSLVANVQYREDLRILMFDSDRIRYRQSMDCPKDEKPQISDPLNGHSQSPYPELDGFITSCVQKQGTSGHIRHWTYFPVGEVLVYEIAKYRWCGNIGRPHKSNNIMLIADLKSAVYYQKCQDPVCKVQNYKSTDYPLPREVLPSTFFEESEADFQDEMDDQECLQAAMEMEKSLSQELATSSMTTADDSQTAGVGQNVKCSNGDGAGLHVAGKSDAVVSSANAAKMSKIDNTATSPPHRTNSMPGASCREDDGSPGASCREDDCWDGDDDFLNIDLDVD